MEYKNVFVKVLDNKIHLGVNSPTEFIIPSHYKKEGSTYIDSEGNMVAQISHGCWFTNLEHNYMPNKLELTANYTPELYPKYDNLNGYNTTC